MDVLILAVHRLTYMKASIDFRCVSSGLKLLGTLSCCALGLSIVLTTGCKKSGDAPPAEAKGGDPADPAGQAATAPPKPAAPAVEVDLRKKWPLGKKLIVQSAATFDSTITAPNQQQPTRQITVMAREFAVTVLGERQGGGYELELEFLKEKFQMNMAGRALVNFDSIADPKTDRVNPGAAALRKVIGSKLKYLTTADGSIESVSGVKELNAKALRGIPRTVSPYILPMYSEQALLKVPDLHTVLPNTKVRQGETWNYTEAVGPMSINFTGTFKGFETKDGIKMAALETKGALGGAGGAGAAQAGAQGGDPNNPAGDPSGAPGGAPGGGDPNMVDPSNPTGGNGAPGPDSITGKIYYDPALGVIREFTAISQISKENQIPGGVMKVVTKVQAVQKVLFVSDAAPAAK